LNQISHLITDAFPAKKEEGQLQQLEKALKDAQHQLFEDDAARPGSSSGKRFVNATRGRRDAFHLVSGSGSEREPRFFIQPHRETLAAIASSVM
jgi:hypothetical protein